MLTKLQSQSVIQSFLYHYQTPASVSRARYEVRAICRKLGYDDPEDIEWSLVTRPVVMAFMGDEAMRAKKPSSQNFTLNIFKGLCREALLCQRMSTEQFNGINQIKGVRGERINLPTLPTIEDVIRVIRTCMEDGLIGIRDAAIFAVGVGTGLRRSEITRLQTKDIEFDEQRLHIVGKGQKKRTVSFCRGIGIILKAWADVRGKEGVPNFLVGLHKSGKLLTDRPLNGETIYTVVRTRMMEIVGKRCSPHDLRRIFASCLLRGKVDVYATRQALGHKDISTTMLYDRREDEEFLAAAASVEILGDPDKLL